MGSLSRCFAGSCPAVGVSPLLFVPLAVVFGIVGSIVVVAVVLVKLVVVVLSIYLGVLLPSLISVVVDALVLRLASGGGVHVCQSLS